MARIDIKSAGGGSVATGVLQLENGVAMDTTLRNVADQNNTTSPLKLSTTTVQVTSPLRITTSDASGFYLDAEDSSTNNRFSIKRDPSSQEVTLDFASNPAGSTTTVGAIRTYVDGVNLSNAVTFREDGQVTFTERVNVEADSLVTTQSSSVITASTTNANLVIAPNGTGALIASIPDGTATGGNARGDDAVDLQIIRGAATNVASGNYSVISGGQSNTASSVHSTVSGGQTNVASTNTHATVVGGSGNTSSGQGAITGCLSNTASDLGSVALGFSCTASGGRAMVISDQSSCASNYGAILGGTSNSITAGVSSVIIGGSSNQITSGDNSFVTNKSNKSTARSTSVFGGQVNVGRVGGLGYLLNQQVVSGDSFSASYGTNQVSTLVANREAILTSGLGAALSLDGTGVTNLIIPDGNNRVWNVVASWSAVVTNITGTATGVSVGDIATECNLFAFKRIAGTSSIVGTVTNVASHNDTSMATAAMGYTTGASQELVPTFSAPTFAGGGSVTIRVVLKLMLTEVAF